MQKNITIARAYATGIFDYAIENQSLEYWKKTLIDINNITKNQHVKHFFYKIYPIKNILNIIEITLQYTINVHMKNFIKLLFINNRLYMINMIIDIFLKLYYDYHNIMYVTVISSIGLTNIQKDKLSQKLHKRFSKKIYFEFKIQPDLIYGMIIKINDMIIEDCISIHIEKMLNFLLFYEREKHKNAIKF